MFESIADDSSDEAKYEEALILIDEGKYDEAGVLLGQLPETEEITVLLASCSSGSVIDLASVISVLNTDDGSEIDPLNALGTILGDENGVVQAADLEQDKKDLADSQKSWVTIFFIMKIGIFCHITETSDMLRNLELYFKRLVLFKQ
ncbi:MAG: hypothetical protein GY756_15515, partial [bacterium]|nr:hypothetical protein [bacterium]